MERGLAWRPMYGRNGFCETIRDQSAGGDQGHAFTSAPDAGPGDLHADAKDEEGAEPVDDLFAAGTQPVDEAGGIGVADIDQYAHQTMAIKRAPG
jgi:hypothetical protein